MRKLVQFALIIWLIGGVWLAMPTGSVATAQSDDNSTCRFNLKIVRFRVLEDMGDGLFDGKMEVKVIISVSNGQLVIDRYDPIDGTIKLSPRETRELENFIFSLPATDTMTIEVLAIEVDEFPSILGVNLDDVLVGFANAIGSLGGVGNVVDGVIESGVSALRDSIASDDTITDDTLFLYADDWWNAGETQTYVTEDGDFEFTYQVTISGCDATHGA